MTSGHRLRFAFDIASPTGVCDCENRLRSDGEKGRVRFASETFLLDPIALKALRAGYNA